jgi:hypothetical protein
VSGFEEEKRTVEFSGVIQKQRNGSFDESS